MVKSSHISIILLEEIKENRGVPEFLVLSFTHNIRRVALKSFDGLVWGIFAINLDGAFLTL